MWELDHKEGWVLKNWCFWTVVLDKILESPLDCKEIKPVNPKGNQSWIFIGRTDAKKKKKKNWCWSSNALASWFKELIHWKRLWCWERLKAGGEGYDKGWDGWMASLIQWTWVWARSGSRWWTGRPDVLQSMGSQRVGHNERLNWRSWKIRKDWETTVRPEETQETQLDTMWVLDGILGRSVLWLVLCKSSCEHMFSVLLSNGL